MAENTENKEKITGIKNKAKGNDNGGIENTKSSEDFANRDIASEDFANRDNANGGVANRDIASEDFANRDIANRETGLNKLVEEQRTTLKLQAKQILKQTELIDEQDRQIEMQRTLLEKRNRLIAEQAKTIEEQKIKIEEQAVFINRADASVAEERERLRSEFTSNISHELKTPITSIYGMSDLLRQQMVKPEDVPQFGKDIHEEAGRLITLVNDIIKISQLDEGVLQDEKKPTDIHKLAEVIIDRLRPVADEKDVKLSLAGEETIVNGVEQILDEMIYNLCDNAIKYNNVGGSVFVATGHNEKGKYLKVEDTGIGIPEFAQKRVFERFFCVDKSHSKTIGGTGLGLSIVKHGAAYHNAKITLTSTLGQGTCITVEFDK